MKVSIIGKIGKNEILPAGFAFGGPASQQLSRPIPLRYAYPSRAKSRAEAELFRTYRLWAFRNKIVRVEDAAGAARAEIITRIKHRVLSEEKAFAKLARAVELFESVEGVPPLKRALLSDEVRVLVWRRDEGKCVRCWNQERLEFDHIIPVEKGGSNTARNIQGTNRAHLPRGWLRTADHMYAH